MAAMVASAAGAAVLMSWTVTQTTGSGNIQIDAQSSGNYGVQLVADGVVEAAGDGAITITVNSDAYSTGVYLSSSSSAVRTLGAGDIDITGTSFAGHGFEQYGHVNATGSC